MGGRSASAARVAASALIIRYSVIESCHGYGQGASESLQTSGLHWRVISICPFEHGGIVIPSLFVAQHPEQERTVRRTEASLSISINGLIWGDTHLS